MDGCLCGLPDNPYRVLMMHRRDPGWIQAYHEWRDQRNWDDRYQWENCWRLAHGGHMITEAEAEGLEESTTCWKCGTLIGRTAAAGWNHTEQTDCDWGQPFTEINSRHDPEVLSWRSWP